MVKHSCFWVPHICYRLQNLLHIGFSHASNQFCSIHLKLGIVNQCRCNCDIDWYLMLAETLQLQVATCWTGILAQTFGCKTVKENDLTRQVWLSDCVAKVVGTRYVATQTASHSKFAATNPADKGWLLAMQAEQSKTTGIRKEHFIRSTAGLCTGMTAWSLAWWGVTVFSVGCALMQACAAVSSCWSLQHQMLSWLADTLSFDLQRCQPEAIQDCIYPTLGDNTCVEWAYE